MKIKVLKHNKNKIQKYGELKCADLQDFAIKTNVFT